MLLLKQLKMLLNLLPLSEYLLLLLLLLLLDLLLPQQLAALIASQIF